MEIKTCEQYVLNRLQDLETQLEKCSVQNEAMSNTINKQTADIRELKDMIERLKVCLKRHASLERDLRICVGSIWNDTDDREDYEFLKCFLELVADKEEE